MLGNCPVDANSIALLSCWHVTISGLLQGLQAWDPEKPRHTWNSVSTESAEAGMAPSTTVLAGIRLMQYRRLMPYVVRPLSSNFLSPSDFIQNTLVLQPLDSTRSRPPQGLWACSFLCLECSFLPSLSSSLYLFTRIQLKHLFLWKAFPDCASTLRHK